MTERRANDLSYGHLGEATYDIETGEWRFLLDPFSQNIQELLPLRYGVRPSITSSPSRKTTTGDRVKWLVKSRPETFPARPILASLARTNYPAHAITHSGQILAVGSAVDVEQTFGSRKTKIIATLSGKAGHVLRLIRPQIQRHEWGRQSSARLSLLDIESQDQGYWVGVGGRILQVAFAEDGNVSTACLAVRQAHATTVFRPVYDATPTPAIVPNGYANPYPSSRLNANPVAVLKVEQTRSGSHVDVTFNPWYPQQFAVVDEVGSWTTWDIEGRRKKGSTTRLIQGKAGNIYEDYIPDPTLKAPDHADGWHQILWVGSVSTILVCNRRHIAVFDVKARPVRIPSREFFTATNSDWILDVKRNPSNMSHMLVLTSSRIYWLEVIPAGEQKDGGTGYRVILSCRHFRDTNDKTMRLSILNRAHESTARVSVAITTMTCSLVNIYTFSFNSDGLDPRSCQDSLLLSNDLKDQENGLHLHLYALHLLEVPLKAIPNRPPGSEVQYIEHDVKFFQVLVVTPDLLLRTGLWSMHFISQRDDVPIPLQVKVPTKSFTYSSGYMTTKRIVDDPWIISDGQVDDGKAQLVHRQSPHHDRSMARHHGNDDSRLTINFGLIYRQAFNDMEDVESSLNEFLENAMDRIRQRKDTAQLTMSTFLGLSQVSGFTEDLEQAAPILRDFLDSFKVDEDLETSSTLVISNLTQCPGISFKVLRDSALPDLLKVYDQVAENWITNLPLRVSGLTRLAKFRIARKVAVELFLSSIGFSLRNKSVEPPSILIPPEGEEPPTLFNKSAATSRVGSPALFSSQIAPSSWSEALSGLPTPSQTPSLYSQSYASTSEYAEDPAISRLRRYASSIKAKPDLRTSKILSHWPVTPGVNPATFSWEEIQRKATAEESGEETDHRKRREAARRERRTERFLNRESTAATEAYSQPGLVPFGSQPDAVQYPASSQTVTNDVPMTQPDRGMFGSRAVQQGKKKQKKKRAAGFR